jgi:D-alanyl-lipoteichoic acid acyltransferase DltB (MBOAT superfamily)
MFNWRDLLLYSDNHPLLFTQYTFWLFFSVLMLFYSVVYKYNKARLIYLMCFSFFFYYKSCGFYFFLLVFSTFYDYYVGNAIYYSKSPGWKKVFVALSVCMNLSLLFFFKYTYFFVGLINQNFGTHFQAYNFLAAIGNAVAGTHFNLTEIILPVGISFYTFQTISYAVDLYRGKIEPARSLLDFGFFVTFFPQLVAGPIVRASEFLPQMYKPYKLSKEDFGRAGVLILGGLMKKILISDYISANFVDRVFDAPKLYSGFENLMAVYGYTIQIYCDFSGYTDIAIGLALLLGFALPINFNSPYKSIDITDFWRRWHISLSTWLRDYLYIPLGGNRKGKIRQYINLMITMFLGGLWHGANLRFVIWGSLHGIGLAFHKFWMKLFPYKDKVSLFRRFIGWFITFHFVAWLWMYFRAPDVDTVHTMLNRIAFNFSPQLVPQIIYGYRIVFGIILAGYIIHWFPLRYKDFLKGTYVRLPLPAKGLVIAAVSIILYQVISAGVQPFIYFQF